MRGGKALAGFDAARRELVSSTITYCRQWPLSDQGETDFHHSMPFERVFFPFAGPDFQRVELLVENGR